MTVPNPQSTARAPSTRRARNFADLAGPDVQRLLNDRSILVQPLGAIEQHGPHLPLNTDLVIAQSVAEAAVDQFGEAVDAWLLPPLAYTKSNEHAWSQGTIWLSAATLMAVLDDIGRCVAATAAKRLVFINGHGGNSTLVGTANREIRLHHGLMTFLTHPGVPPDQGGTSDPGEHGMGVHGGADETSVMLHLAPHLCDMTKAERRIPQGMIDNKYVRFGGRVSFGWMSDDFFADGYIGDPTVATAERGRELFEGSVTAFGEALAEISTFNFGK